MFMEIPLIGSGSPCGEHEIKRLAAELSHE
jgi:hypothetical protein